MDWIYEDSISGLKTSLVLFISNHIAKVDNIGSLVLRKVYEKLYWLYDSILRFCRKPGGGGGGCIVQLQLQSNFCVQFQRKGWSFKHELQRKHQE